VSLDTKYRPVDYDDVLGQETWIRILRRFVATGTQFRQSYLFAGPFGSGKTTLGRILARALLCDAPTPAGDPCNACPSCRSMIETENSIDFTEVDAATNSGKAEINRIKEELQYSTFSGRRRIYLFDESHQLSKDALDAMLKPLEENVPGTQDKRLVCIFCTTEPEKMRATILSRCAAAFVIQPVLPAIIAKRLEMICQKEGIGYEFDALVTLAEVTECHIRDAIKAIEGVSMLGDVTKENAGQYLKLDLNTAYLDVLENIGTDLAAAMRAVRSILERTSPVAAYEKLADVALLAYQTSLGAVKPYSFWDFSRLDGVGRRHGMSLLGFVNRFASRPGRPTAAMLMCDVGHLHHAGGNLDAGVVIVREPTAPAAVPFVPAAPAENVPVTEGVKKTNPSVDTQSSRGNVEPSPSAVPAGRGGGVHVDRRAVQHKTAAKKSQAATAGTLTPEEFGRLLAVRLLELGEANGAGLSRRFDLDHCGAEPTRGGQG